MITSRISLFEQERRTPRGRLDKWWRQTTPLMSVAIPVRVIDDKMSDLHEKFAKFKQWADRKHAKSGIYLDNVVQKFFAQFS